jgi:hypothetical protein
MASMTTLSSLGIVKDGKLAGCWWLMLVILATQENLGSKPAQATSLQDLILKNPVTKNCAGGVAQGKGPEFKPQYCKKKKEKKKKKKTKKMENS